MTPSDPPYLEVSPSVMAMLDFVLITYVYLETLRQDEERQKAASEGMKA